MISNLLNNVKISVCDRGDTGADSSGVTGSYVDMSGFDGCLFLSSIVENTAGVSTGSYELIIYHCDSTTSTSFTSLGTQATAGSGTACSTSNIGDFVAIDIIKPLKRYLKPYIEKDGAAACQGSPIYAIQYNMKKGPVTQSTTYCMEEITLVSPST